MANVYKTILILINIKKRFCICCTNNANQVGLYVTLIKY